MKPWIWIFVHVVVQFVFVSPIEAWLYYYILDLMCIREQSITLEIKREIVAELLSSDFPWTTSEPDVKHPGTQNPSHEVSLVATLQAGEQKKITYNYKEYVRS